MSEVGLQYIYNWCVRVQWAAVPISSCRRRSGSRERTGRRRLAVNPTGGHGASCVEVHRGWVMSETVPVTTRSAVLECLRWPRRRTTSVTTSTSQPSTSRLHCRQVTYSYSD